MPELAKERGNSSRNKLLEVERERICTSKTRIKLKVKNSSSFFLIFYSSSAPLFGFVDANLKSKRKLNDVRRHGLQGRRARERSEGSTHIEMNCSSDGSE